MPEFLRAREAFSLTSKSGLPRVITPGTVISSDDPDYKGREHLFEPVEVSVAHSVAARTETTSAAPGELRSLGRKPGKKGAASKPPAPEPPRQPEPPKTEEPPTSEPPAAQHEPPAPTTESTPEPPKGDD